jgi:hypothetical protein
VSTELLAEHLTKKLAELEDTLAERGQAAHAAAVERAAKIRDHTLADFLRSESAPAHIRERIASIRQWMKYGQMERAYRDHESLRLRLDKISEIVRAPFFATGVKQRRVLTEWRNAGNEKTSAVTAKRHAEWQGAADDVWSRNPEFSRRAVAINISSGFPDVKADTIRKAIRKKLA